MSVFYMMVGLPGSGKSTWASSMRENIDLSIISTDTIIELVGDIYGFTYNELFSNITYSFAEKMSHLIAKKCFEKGDVVIWDQTNLTVKSRGKKLLLVPEGYRKVAVYIPEPPDLIERLQHRLETNGKLIPTSVIEDMKRRVEEPTLQEGFDEIIVVPTQTEAEKT